MIDRPTPGSAAIFKARKIWRGSYSHKVHAFSANYVMITPCDAAIFCTPDSTRRAMLAPRREIWYTWKNADSMVGDGWTSRFYANQGAKSRALQNFAMNAAQKASSRYREPLDQSVLQSGDGCPTKRGRSKIQTEGWPPGHAPCADDVLSCAGTDAHAIRSFPDSESRKRREFIWKLTVQALTSAPQPWSW